MPITRYWVAIRDEWDIAVDDRGDWVGYEDHLAEVARLEHIISGAEAEIQRLAKENARLREYFDKLTE